MQAIEREKRNLWRRYLLNLTVNTLFQARKHVSGRRTSTLLFALIDPRGGRCVTNKYKDEALFRATCVAMAECDLADVYAAPPPPTNPTITAMYYPSPKPSLSSASIFNSLK